ncbi:putative RNA-directed DNA polymerase [Helianthus annuus]|nr:putative RNA-directed DNA polymerase [Helianthus annuus]
MGHVSRKAQSVSHFDKVGSPIAERPTKRPRESVNEEDPGFGYVGFTDRARNNQRVEDSVETGGEVRIDLNVRANSEGPPIGMSKDAPEIDAQVLERGNGEATSEVRNQGGAADEEVQATIDIGAQLGVEFGHRTTDINKLLGVSEKQRWVKELKLKHGIGFMALQESKRESISPADLAGFWGSRNFAFDSVDSAGYSGGLVCLWDVARFSVSSVVKNRNYLLIRGKLVGSDSVLNVLNVYAPQGVPAKKILWDELVQLISISDGFWVVLGDFNAVRFREEKKNCEFKVTCASNFNSFIFEAGLLEYNMRGRKFTYSSSIGNKHSKLDRFLVNAEFFNKWPDASVEAVSTFLSDHCSLIMKTAAENFGPRPFRIFDSWFDKSGFSEVVSKVLKKDEGWSGPPDSCLMRKLCVLRAELKVWRDNMLKSASEEVLVALSDLENVQSVMEVRDLTEDEEWTFMECKRILLEEEERKSSDLRQRSRVNWAKCGDENSKFFHAMVNCRKASNRIHGLEVDGSWVSKPNQVKKEIFRFFRSKFVEECVIRPRLLCSNMRKLSDSDAAMLDSRFSKEEIKAAVFGCDDDRAPGPDGINFRFVKRFWDLVESDFVDIMDAFYVNGEISPGCGSSFIALIPKVIDPIGLKDYRPISLVGIINKVISKILANRLKRVLDSIISPSQSAFISGRYILDGPLIVNEIQNWAKKAKRKIFLLKIDFEKAYDNINWNFLIDILRQMGFSEKWCLWIKGVVSSARASVLVNGSPTFEFKCHKGMRQGDPISPFLFVIVMEALSCMIVRACGLGILKGVSLPNGGPVVSHLFYADDAVIMGEWSRENVLNVVRILRCFHICSGLKINLSKSNLFGVGSQQVEVEEMADVVGCRADAFPFKFLGLSVGANMGRISSWRPVFDVFEKRLSLWKASTLSLGGRVTLIRSVLESLPNYFLSLYLAPVKVIRDLESIIRKFLWGGFTGGS